MVSRAFTEYFQDPIAIQLNGIPQYMSPPPTMGTIQRNDDLELYMILSATKPGCKMMNDGPNLRMGEMGFAGQLQAFAETLGANIEFSGWADKSDANFKTGKFEYSGPVTRVRMSFDGRRIGNRCIVRCSNGPKIWGPPSVKVQLNTSDYKITLYKTPKKLEQLRCVTLEIESQKCLDLDEDHVENILTSLSFISGRRLASYEIEFFNETDLPALVVAHPPHVYSVKEYNEASWFPIQNQAHLLLKDAGSWAQLLELTLKLNKKIPLRNILINVWYARPLALGGNLVFYSAALESLVDAWFNLSENQIESDRIPKTEFLPTISPVITEIQELEKRNPRWKKVRDNIEKANQYSGTSKILRFYELHNLETKEVEKAIRLARHRFAHGADFTTEEDQALFALTHAGEALINRLILKLSGYRGKYVDYSTYDFPMRDISEQLGGPNGNGMPLESPIK